MSYAQASIRRPELTLLLFSLFTSVAVAPSVFGCWTHSHHCRRVVGPMIDLSTSTFGSERSILREMWGTIEGYGPPPPPRLEPRRDEHLLSTDWVALLPCKVREE